MPNVILAQPVVSAIAPDTALITHINPDLPAEPQHLIRLKILLEDRLGNERLVDLVVNCDRFCFVVQAIRAHFDREWRFSESWEADVPF